MKVNGLVLEDSCLDYSFFQAVNCLKGKDMKLPYNTLCLEYIFTKLGILKKDTSTPVKTFDIFDSYNVFNLVRILTELDLPLGEFIEDIYDVRSKLDTTVVLSLFPYLRNDDHYRGILSELTQVPDLSDYEPELLSLLIEVKPILVLSQRHRIKRRKLRRLCLESRFNASCCRDYYRIIREYISAQEFMVYLDKDDIFLTQIVDQRVRLFAPAGQSFDFRKGGVVFIKRPRQPLYLGLGLWPSNFSTVYTIKKIIEGLIQVEDSMHDCVIFFDVLVEPTSQLLIPLTREHYFA